MLKRSSSFAVWYRSICTACISYYPGSYKMDRTREMNEEEKEERNKIIKSYYYENKILFGDLVKDVTKPPPPEKKRIRIIKVQKPVIKWKNLSDKTGDKENNTTEVTKLTTTNVTKNTSETNTWEQFASNVARTSSPIQTSADARQMLSFPFVVQSKIDMAQNKLENEMSFPSVSQILQKTMPAESVKALEDWKMRMIAKHGEEEFERIHQEILSRGHILHDYITDYLKGNKDVQVPDSCAGLWVSLRGVIDQISETLMLEQMVVHPYLAYKGRLDCCAVYNNMLCLIEWKTSRRPRTTLKDLYDYPLQAAAYMGAVNATRSDVKLRDAVIVVAYPTLPAEVHHIGGPELIKYWKLWLRRLNMYWSSVMKLE